MDGIDILSDENLNKLNKSNLIALVKQHQTRRHSTSTDDSNLTLSSIEALLDKKLAELTSTFVDRIERVEADNEELRVEVKSLKAQLTSMQETKAREIKNIKNEENTRELQCVSIDAVTKELSLRESKKTNLVIFGVAENPNETNEELTGKVKHICEVLNVKFDSRKSFRIGRSDNSTKHRPIITQLNNHNSRNDLLKKARDLRNQTNELKNVYISPDLTPQQQKQRKTLYEEFKRRKQQGENIKILHDTIVNA